MNLNLKTAAPKVARILLGLIFFLSGLAGLLNLAPPPKDMPPAMLDFFNGMQATVYFFPFLKLTETICGLMLIVRIAPALALVILAPIMINIVLVHGFMTPGAKELIVPVVMSVMMGLAASAYWNVYRPLFRRN